MIQVGKKCDPVRSDPMLIFLSENQPSVSNCSSERSRDNRVRVVSRVYISDITRQLMLYIPHNK